MITINYDELKLPKEGNTRVFNRKFVIQPTIVT